MDIREFLKSVGAAVKIKTEWMPSAVRRDDPLAQYAYAVAICMVAGQLYGVFDTYAVGSRRARAVRGAQKRVAERLLRELKAGGVLGA